MKSEQTSALISNFSTTFPCLMSSTHIPLVVWYEIFSNFHFKRTNITRIFGILRLVCKRFREIIATFWCQRIDLSSLATYLTFSPSLCSSVRIISIEEPELFKYDELILPANFAAIFCSLEELHSVANINIKYFSFLPKTLRKLIFDSITPSQEEIDNEDFKNLPPFLTDFTLPDGGKLNDKGLSYLPRSLKTLDLRNRKRITDEGFKFLPPFLQSLNLRGTYITNAGLTYLPSTLISLNLSNCSNITVEGFQFLPKKLQILDLEWTNITNEGLAYLPRSLVSLNLSYCSNISDEGLLFLKDFKKLEELFLTDTEIEGSAFPSLNFNLKIFNQFGEMDLFLASIYFGNLESTIFFIEKIGIKSIHQDYLNSIKDMEINFSRRNRDEVIQYLKETMSLIL